MNISKDKMVSIHYTLKGDDGATIDSSQNGQPLEYIQGNGILISGLEKALENKKPGDKFSVTINPEEGYGKFDDKLIMDIPRDKFETEEEIVPGMKFQVQTPEGVSIVRVIEVSEGNVKIDGNHELAGKNLHFDVEVVDVRDATEDELKAMSQGCGGCGGDCDGNCGCDGDCR